MGASRVEGKVRTKEQLLCFHGNAGTGGKPSLGAQAAEESEEAIKEAVSDADLVFITAGMGGGTGSGAAPAVARWSREAGHLTVGVVTFPFTFEGSRRARQVSLTERAGYSWGPRGQVPSAGTSRLIAWRALGLPPTSPASYRPGCS